MPFYRGLNLSGAPFKSFCIFLTEDPPTEAVTLAVHPSILFVCFPPSFPLPRSFPYQCGLFVSFVSHRGYLIHCFSSFLHIVSTSSLLCSQTPSFSLFTSLSSFTLLMASTSQVRFSLFSVVYFSSLFVFFSIFLYL